MRGEISQITECTEQYRRTWKKLIYTMSCDSIPENISKYQSKDGGSLKTFPKQWKDSVV
jgi:hypothetical protein